MFLFVSNTDRIKLRRPHPAIRGGKNWHIHQHGPAVVVWQNSLFTSSERSADRLVIWRRRAIDDEPVCVFEWCFEEGHLSITRRWSGEFSILIAQDSELLITSHLRLASLAFDCLPPGLRQIRPESVWTYRLGRPHSESFTRGIDFKAPYRHSYSQTLNIVRRRIFASIKRLPDSSALLLSGGLDSSIIAAVAREMGKPLRCFVFAAREPLRSRADHEDDLFCARLVARHLSLSLTEILLNSSRLIKNVPLAILLAETRRATIIDPCTALIEVAKTVSRAGISSIVMGEAADDLFGSFTFALRYKRGQGLRKYYRAELDDGLPDEKAIIQRVFEPWGISVFDPFWTRELKAIGYNIPLSFRLDRKRLMKRILRDAFADMLPPTIVRRPKVVTRDGSQVRYVLESHFGTSRDRYRPLFKQIFASGATWPENLRHLKSWQSLKKP
jgi:asparagine synthetase B (glutamine-hydrolysing)